MRAASALDARVRDQARSRRRRSAPACSASQRTIGSAPPIQRFDLVDADAGRDRDDQRLARRRSRRRARRRRRACTCGLTASTIVAGAARRHRRCAHASRRRNRARAHARSAASGSATAIDGARTPPRISAPIRLRAMLPPPMKAMRAGIRDSGFGIRGHRSEAVSYCRASISSALMRRSLPLSRLRERAG